MDKGYEAFCLRDHLFYDSPMLAHGDDVRFRRAEGPVPEGWSRDELEDWLVYTPLGVQFPTQGWKIHASASLSDAEQILEVIWDYCIGRRIAFKFVRSPQLLLLANGKYAGRASSGKFVTIYPLDEFEFQSIVTELGKALVGLEGPYILSDVRWEEGPLYVRYGAFAERYCLTESGEMTPAIEDDTGDLVPDKRGTTFSVPTWVAVPSFLEPQIAARASTGLADLAYTINAPLHFSNGGGVYAATDRRSGETVVLKEARPYAGLAMDGSDAVSRFERERDVLRRLAGLDVVPGVRDYFTLGGHHFMVLDYIEGSALAHVLVDRYPLALLGKNAGFQEYTDWALAMVQRVADAVTIVHERGLVIGDLHPSNILMRPSGDVVLIDFEIAADANEGARPSLGDPGFAAPSDRSGFDIDYYALACLTLFMFLPLTELLGLDAFKARQLAVEIAREFPVSEAFLDDIVGRIEGKGATRKVTRATPARRLVAERTAWPHLRDSMASAILATATPERHDRLFPGDIAQFEKGGLNLAFGAAGVLYALHATGAGRYPAYEDWLVERATNPRPGTRLGFYDGLHGVAWGLHAIGRHEDALEVLGICTDELEGKWPGLGLDLFGGLAGIGLNLCHFAEVAEKPDLWKAATEVAEVVADGLGDEDDAPTQSGGKHPYAGLTRGASGPALFFLRLHDHFGDDQLLDLAATALRQDLRRCVLRGDGALEVNEGYRTMPYLHDGSLGVGLVLEDYLTRRHDADFAEAAAAVRVAASAEFYIESGLFSGRAGMIYHLAQSQPYTEALDPVISGHIERLAWHALDYQGHLAFPGDQLMRLSMDLATGTAGVLLAVGTALHDQPIALPFFGPRQRTVVRPVKGGE